MIKGVIARLLAGAGVAAIVGDRIWPMDRPQGQPLPAVVVRRIDQAPLYQDSGSTGLERARVQVDCWADTPPAAIDLAVAVKAQLNDFEGASAGTTFQSVTIIGEHDNSETGAGRASYPRRVGVDFEIWFTS